MSDLYFDHERQFEECLLAGSMAATTDDPQAQNEHFEWGLVIDPSDAAAQADSAIPEAL